MSNLSTFQKFTFETWNRKDFKKADYNPRKITPKAQKELKKVLKTKGLVQPIIVNKRTGNIVGGHQRITILDQLEGRDDYDLSVCVVDVDEKEEKEINILLNNTAITGEYDLIKLNDLTFEADIKLGDLGFDLSSINDIITESLLEVESEDEAIKVADKIREQAGVKDLNQEKKEKEIEKLKNMSEEERVEYQKKKKELYDKVDQSREKYKYADGENNVNHQLNYLVVKFQHPDQMIEFLEANGLDVNTKYLAYEVLQNVTFI